jgi:hypothetical protein
MIYNDVVALFRSVSQSIGGTIYFNEGPDPYRNREDIDGLGENTQGIWLLPMTPTWKQGDHLKSWQFILVFYKQTKIDALQDQLRQIVHDAMSVGESFFDTLDEASILFLSELKFSPGYKELDNSFTGGAYSGTITLPGNACITYDAETGIFDITFDATFA